MAGTVYLELVETGEKGVLAELACGQAMGHSPRGGAGGDGGFGGNSTVRGGQGGDGGDAGADDAFGGKGGDGGNAPPTGFAGPPGIGGLDSFTPQTRAASGTGELGSNQGEVLVQEAEWVAKAGSILEVG